VGNTLIPMLTPMRTSCPPARTIGSASRAINERATVAAVSGPCEIFEQHDEFVSADTRRRIHLPQLVPEASGDGYEEFVTHRMTECIVDVLEVVEIEEEHCADTAVALG
jgi:hypothetical protein